MAILLNFVSAFPDAVSKTPAIKIVVAPFHYIEELDVKASDELLLREHLIAAMSGSAQWNLTLIEDSLSGKFPVLDREQLRLLGSRHHADYVLSGEMVLADVASWAISFEVLSMRSLQFDTTFNADPQTFQMTGSIEIVIRAGLIEKMLERIQSYILSLQPGLPWWKKPKALIAMGMLGVASVAYVSYEIFRDKEKPKPVEQPDLPVSPDPPK